MHFGATLKLLRVTAGLSLRALARRVGVSSAYLSRVENGHDPAPTPDRLTAIAAALELPPDMLVELAKQTGPALASYIERVPAAAAFFLDVARRDLDADQLARLRAVMDTELAHPPAETHPTTLRSLIGQRIILGLPCAGIDDVIAAGAVHCAGAPGALADEIARLLHEREADAPTALGNGVAVPHAVVPDARTAATLVTLAEPLAVDSPDGEPVEIAIVLVSKDGGREHLEALAHIARLARHRVAGKLRRAHTKARALAVLERIEAM